MIVKFIDICTMNFLGGDLSILSMNVLGVQNYNIFRVRAISLITGCVFLWLKIVQYMLKGLVCIAKAHKTE